MDYPTDWKPTKAENPSKPMTLEEQEAEVKRITEALLKNWGSHMNNPTFAARDLGFPEHTKIHEAARAIIARYAAGVIVYDRQYRL